MAIPWTPALAIGVPEIDHQHQELFYRLGRLLEGIVGGDRAEVGRLLEFLGDYVVRHFGAEERWMVQSGFPAYELHKAEHDAFMQQYLAMQIEYEQNGPTALMGMRANNWIGSWLRDHISVKDMELGRYLSKKIA
jgi:hemerythrin